MGLPPLVTNFGRNKKTSGDLLPDNKVRAKSIPKPRKAKQPKILSDSKSPYNGHTDYIMPIVDTNSPMKKDEKKPGPRIT